MPHTETTRRHRRAMHRLAMRPIAHCVMLACCELALANPTAPQVAAGAATFATSGRTLTVTNAPGTIINWNTFSIGAGETTRFLQQSAASAVLNRVVGRDVSSLLGTLSSNGRVFLINPNGIVFGAGAVIDTAGFIASTLNMSDPDFLSGKLRFGGGGNGIVHNAGTIRASGDIVLVGPAIQNSGILRSDNGSVLLAAGKALTITSPDAHGITFTVQAPADSVVNIGSIEAANAGSMFAGTLRHSGDINVTTVQRDGAGRVVLMAQGDATVDGSIRANSAAGTGGSVKVLGDRVTLLDGASIRASGPAGGGTILIGGDYRGSNPDVQNAAATLLAAGATVRADALQQGDGGRVVVWSNDSTRVYGLIGARGAGGGKGGFVETSGHFLDARRRPDLGEGGTWLLDPRNLFVNALATTATSNSSGGNTTYAPSADDSIVFAGDINAQLDAGTNVILDTNVAGTQEGNITVQAGGDITKSVANSASLTFNATRSISVFAPINLGTGSGSINMTTTNAAGTVTIGRTVTAGGAMNLNLAGGLVVQSADATPAGLIANTGQTIAASSVTVDAQNAAAQITNNTSGAQSITAGAGGVTLNGANTGSSKAATITQNATAGTQTINSTGNIQLNGGTGAGTLNSADIRQNGTSGAQTVTTAGSLVMTAGNAVGAGANCGAAGSCATLVNVGSGGQSVTAAGITMTAGGGGDNNSAFLNNNAAASAQQITITGGGAIAISGGTGTGSNNQAALQSDADQTVTFNSGGTLSLTGGTNGQLNFARLQTRNNAVSSQTITGVTGITLTGGANGGGYVTGPFATRGNFAQIAATGDQDITVGAGGITMTGGGGSQSDNFASIHQSGTAAARHQNITVNGGGPLALTGGSSSGASAAVEGSGSFATIRADGGGGGPAGSGQTISFGAAGSAITMTGGTAGTGNEVRIRAQSGQQTISGSPSLTMTGGASGGATADGNSANIFADTGAQNLTLGTTQISAGSGGIDTFAGMQAPNQTITVNGNLTINGGAGSGSAAARIGSSPGSAMNLGLTVHGDLAMNGGPVSTALLSISGNSIVQQNADITINTDGNITLTGGAGGLVRIGQPATLSGGGANNGAGNIVLTAGGNISIPASTAGTEVRTAGNVTLNANSASRSITQAAANNVIRANTLTASAHSGVALKGNNVVTNFSATNTNANGIEFTQAAGNALTVTGIPQVGGNATITADDLDIMGAIQAGTGTVTLRPTTLSRNVNIAAAPTAGTLSLSPAEIGLVTAGQLDIGRLDGTGTLTLATALPNSNVNASTLRLLENDISINADIGTSVTRLDRNLELQAANNATISLGNIFVGDSRNLTVTADADNSGAGSLSIGAVQMLVGIGAPNSGNMTLQGNSIFFGLGGGGSNMTVEVSGSGTQTIRARDTIQFTNTSTGSGSLNVRTTAGMQTIDTCQDLGSGCTTTGIGNMALQGGANGALVSVTSQSGSQNINLKGGLQVSTDTASNGSGNAVINAASGQTIAAQFIEVTSRGGGQGAINNNTGTQNASTQTITTRGQNASSEGIRVEALGTGPNAGIFNLSTGLQSITTNNANKVVIRGTTGPSIVSSNGSQSLTLGGTGAHALEITSTSGTAGLNKNGTAGSQSVTINGGGSITIAGGDGAAGNRVSQIYSQGTGGQTVTFGAGGSVAIAAGTVGTNNSAKIQTENGNQTITGATSLSLTAGASGGGNTAFISSSGGLTTAPGNQSITVTGGVALTGGADGTSNTARIAANAAGVTQTINAGAIAVTGGASGGGVNVGNSASLQANAGTQNIATGAVVITAGAAGTDNSATITSPAQTITASTVAINGGGSANLGGARIGGVGTNGPTPTNLTLTTTGDITLTGGSVSGATIGNCSTCNQSTDITINGGGNVTLTAGAGGTARLGSPSTSVAGGNIAVSATGNFSMTGNAAVNATILTTGNITLSATNNIAVQDSTINAGGTSSLSASNGLTVIASADPALITSTGTQTITVGAGGLTLTGAGGSAAGDSAQITQTGAAGTQTITVNGGGNITLTGGAGSGNNNFARISASGTAQNLTFNAGGNIVMSGGTVGNNNFADIRANNATVNAQTQTISGVTGIAATGGTSGGGTDANNNALGNFAQIRNSNGSQSVSAGAGGISLTGGSGPLTDNFAQIIQGDTASGAAGTSQTVTLNSGGSLTIAGGSSAQTNVIGGSGNPNNFFRGSYASIQANGDSQQITFNGGGSATLTGGTVGSNNVAQIQSRFGTQTVSGAPNITLTGGASGGTQNGTVNEGNFARLVANAGNQTITAGTVTLTGGAGGTNNSARVDALGASALQTVNASGVAVTGGSGGAPTNANATGNSARVRSAGSQNITVGSGGLSVLGGSGSALGNHADFHAAGTASNSQLITVNGGGAILVRGGSTTGTNVGVDANGNGNGSFANITADGDTQTINFAAGGAINIVGGTVGSRNSASIRMPTTSGTQTVTGAPAITLTGGASGGASGEGNSANLSVDAGSQNITAGAIVITGGASGTDNSATIRSPAQTIGATTVTITGGGATGLAGARIGGGSSVPSATNLTLTTTGNVTLTGGSVNAALLGGSSAINDTRNIDVTVNSGGDITLTGGSGGEARVGSPAALVQAGTLSLTAAGNIALNDGPGAASNMRTAGNVVLQATAAGRSISEGAASSIRANTLTANAHSGITLNGNNNVTSLNASNSTANGIQFAQTPGTLLTLTGMTQTGGNVQVTADDIDVTGAINAGANTVVLRPVTLSRNVNIEPAPTAGTLSLSPADLNFITAGQLDIGRLDGSGTLALTAGMSNADINAATLRLLSGADVSITGFLGGTGTEFNNSLTALANNDVAVNSTTLLFADGQNVTLTADNDASGAGNLTLANSSGANRAVLAGTSSGNTASMTLQGRNITVGGGSDGMGVVLRGTGTQTVTTPGTLLIQAGNATSAPAQVTAAEGVQSVNADGVVVLAGSGGSSSSASLSGVSQTLSAGAGGITVTAGGGVSNNLALIQQTGANAVQTITVVGGGDVTITGGSGSGSTNGAEIVAGGTSQMLTFGPGSTINLAGGTNGQLNFARIRTAAPGSVQSITGAAGITLTGGASGGGFSGTTTLGNFASIFSNGVRQAITADAGGITLNGGSGGQTDNFASLFFSNLAGITPPGGPTGQALTVQNGGNVTLTGGSSSGGGNGAPNGSGAFVTSVGNAQTLTFTGGGNLTITGGTVGAQNPANFVNTLTTGSQTITGATSITLTGGASGGAEGPSTVNSFGNFASLRSNGNQDITVGAGGITARGGSGTADNFAQVRQGQTTTGNPATPGTHQTITINSGGNIVLAGGSTTAVATANGNGSYGRIRGEGDTQTIAFTAGGSISVTGGTVGTSNRAEIVSNSGAQTITGSPGVTLRGGASGGAAGGDGNFAQIRSDVSQTLTFGGVDLGSGTGTDTFATIQSPTQNITINGNLILSGANAGTGNANGARFGGNVDGPTNIALTVHGNATLNGGSASNAIIGASGNSASPQTANITLSVDGDLTLNGGTANAATRVGQPGGVMGGGNIVVTAGGNVALGGASSMRTAGDLTVNANGAGKSFSANATSFVVANRLVASGNAGVNLPGPNQVSRANLTSGGGSIAFVNTQPLTFDGGAAASSLDTPAGAQTVAVTTTGAASDITFTGNLTGNDDVYTLTSGRDFVFAGGTTIDGQSVTLAGAGSAQFGGGTVTLNIPVTANLPLNLSGATVNFNAATSANNGATLSAGTLQGSGNTTVSAGTFTWSGGAAGGTGALATAGGVSTNVTGNVALNRAWNNSGAVHQTGGAAIASSSAINNLAGGAWNGTSTTAGGITGGAFNNAGTFTSSNTQQVTSAFANAGTVNVNSGTLTMTNFPTNAGTLAVAGGATLATGGAPLANTGTLTGSGTIAANVTNSGNVTPGTSPGLLTISGDFTQTPAGTLNIEVAGTNPGAEHDVLAVTGTATLGGTLNVVAINGYTPPPGQTFSFLNYGNRSGDFNNVSSGYSATPGPTSYAVASPAPPPPPAETVLAAPTNEVVTLSSSSEQTAAATSNTSNSETASPSSSAATTQEAQTKKEEKAEKKEVARDCR